MKTQTIRSIIALSCFIFISVSTHAGQFTWTGNVDTVFTKRLNWNSVNTSGDFPNSNDSVFIGTITSNRPVLDQNRDVFSLRMMTGSQFDLKSNTFTVQNKVVMDAGTLSGGNLVVRGTLAQFNGTNFTSALNVEADVVELNGGTFGADCIFKINGQEVSTGQGGCTFNGDVTLVCSASSGKWTLAATYGDVFNGILKVYQCSDSPIYLSTSDTTRYNDNVELNNTGSASIVFGDYDGLSYLASGKTISVGDSGYAANDLYLSLLTQSGSTSQDLTLTGTASLFLKGCYFDAPVTLSAPGVLCAQSAFQDSATITKTGTDDNYWFGNNEFYGPATIANSGSSAGSEELRLSDTYGNRFYGNATFQSSGKTINVDHKDNTDFYADVSTNHSEILFKKSITFKGGDDQMLYGTTGLAFQDVTLDKTSGNVTTDTTMEVNGTFTFTNGYLVTDTMHLLTMTATSSATGASDASFVSGPVKKVGDAEFDFPIGKDSYYRTIGISTLSVSTDAFVAEYFNDEQNLGNEMDSTIDYITPCNYWSLFRSSGSSNADITLSWKNDNCPLLDSSDLRIASWNDTIWNDLGQENFTGIFENGKISNSVTPNVFSYFSLSYASTPLPYVILGQDTSVETGLFTYSNVDAFGTLQWIPASGLSCTDCLQPDMDISISKKYFLIASDYKNHVAIDSVLIRMVPNQLPYIMLPPAVEWRYEHWSSSNPYDTPASYQSQQQSGDEWWYGHSNSLDDNNQVDGYICAGYSSYVNKFFDDSQNGGCTDPFISDPCDVECSAFEHIDSGCNGTLNNDELKRGRLLTSLGLKSLDGEEYKWHKNFGIGNLYMAKTTGSTNEYYLAVGYTESTIIPFLNTPIIYNPLHNVTNPNLCTVISSGKPSLAYVIKVNKNDGSPVWQYIYGQETLGVFANLGTDYRSTVLNFIEIPGYGYRLVGSSAYSGSTIPPGSNIPAPIAWILDIDYDGDYINSYFLPVASLGHTSIASDIVRYYANNQWINIVSGRFTEWQNSGYLTVNQKVFVTAFIENFGTLDFNTDELWSDFDSFDNNSFTTHDNSSNNYLKLGKDNNGDPILLLPVLYGCGQTGLYAMDNICEGKIYKLSIDDGSILDEISIGEVEAFDLKMDVTPTDDNGFVVLSTKKGLNHSRSWSDPQFCENQPIGYWNTDAFVAKYNSTDTDPEWWIEFDKDDEPPVFYPGDYKKQECMYTITNAPDGGFILAGNSSSNFDDYYLCKLQSDCITRNASFADVLDDLDFKSDIGDGTTPTTVVWDSDKSVLGSVNIKANAELQITGNTTTISFSDSRRVAKTDGHNIITNIVVEPGGKLTIEEGATLDVISSNTNNTCNDGMWDGIQILGNSNTSQTQANQGLCEINSGATVTNARIGIIAGEAHYDDEFEYLQPSLTTGLSGGIIRAFEANFINNRQSIHICPYHFQSSYSTVSVSGNNFICDDILKDPYYKHPDDRPSGMLSFIQIVDNVNINLITNEFTGNINLDPDIRGSAIDCHQCAATISQGNSFTDLTYGIQGKYITFGSTRSLQIVNNQFDNVQGGISLIGNAFSNIKNNSFNIPEGSNEFHFPYGVWMDNSNSFSISDENTFSGIANGNNYGVIVTNSGIGGGEIAHNSFDDTQTGTQTEQENPALQIRCNTYVNHSHSWVINPNPNSLSNPGSLSNQGNGCDDQDPYQYRATNEFNDGCIANVPVHIYSPNISFIYYGPKDVDTSPDPFDDCSVILSPGYIEHCHIANPDHSCDLVPPPGNERSAWFEMIDTTNNEQYKQFLWMSFLREIIVLDTLGQDTTIISFIDSLDESVAKWYQVSWYLDKQDKYVVDSLLDSIALNNKEDSALFTYNSLLLNLLNIEGNYYDLNGDRISQLNSLLSFTSSVAKRAGALIEIAGIEKFNYEPEQIPEERLSAHPGSNKNEINLSTPNLLVYPNPSDGICKLQFWLPGVDTEKSNIEIYNNVGSKLWLTAETFHPGINEMNLNMTQFPPGIYHCKVFVESEILVTKISLMR